jgi:natural resistance-associated macrophage protein
LVWVLFWSHVLGFFFQNLASRLGVVTGKDLSQHIRKQYPKGVKNLLWFMTEAAIIGSDIQEVIGTAIALYILLGIPFWLGVIVTIVDTMTFLLLQQYGMRKLELFFISLILVMGSCFVAELFLTDIYIESIISGLLLPTIPPKAMVQTAGMIGAVIMPHNIYLHSGLVSRRNINRLDRNGNEVKIANQFFLVENASALLVSFLINLSIMAVFSQVFYYSKGEVPSTNVGLLDASYALSASLGSLSKYLWAIGLLAAGQCSTMTGTLAGQYVMEGFWKYSLDPWKRILFTRSLAIIPSIITTIVAADYLDVLGEYLNALQSLQLPFAIIPLLKFTYDIKLMGPKFVNSRSSQLFYIFIIGVIVCINMFLLYQIAHQWALGSIFSELIFWSTFLGYLYCIYKVVKLPHNYNFD